MDLITIIIAFIISVVGSIVGTALIWKVRRPLTRLDSTINHHALTLWHRCHAGITSRWAAVRSWPRRGETVPYTLRLLIGASAAVCLIANQTFTPTPVWAQFTAIGIAVFFASYGLWIIANTVWQMTLSGAQWAHRWFS